MTTTVTQDKDFAKTLAVQIKDDVDDAVNGLKDKIIDDILPDFKKDFLEQIKKQTADFVIDWIQESMTPAEVFSKDDLEAWAMANGWTRP